MQNDVNRVSFKGCLEEDEIMRLKDRETIKALSEQFENVTKLLQADKTVGIGLELDDVETLSGTDTGSSTFAFEINLAN